MTKFLFQLVRYSLKMSKFSKESFATGIYSLAIRCLFNCGSVQGRKGRGTYQRIRLTNERFLQKEDNLMTDFMTNQMTQKAQKEQKQDRNFRNEIFMTLSACYLYKNSPTEVQFLVSLQFQIDRRKNEKGKQTF